MVVDPRHQYGSGLRQNPLPGFVVIKSIPQLVTYFRRYRAGSFRVLFQPGSDPGADVAWEFDACTRLVLSVRDTVYLVDEIWEFTTATLWPKSLQYMARTGRHHGITLIWTAQQPQSVAYGLRSVTNQWYVFRLTNRRDIDALVGNLPDEAIAKVPTLPDRVYIARDDRFNWRVMQP